MAGVSKNFLAVLMVIAIIISLVGTLTILASTGFIKTVPTESSLGSSSGTVSVYVMPEPSYSTGKVTVNVIPSE